MARRISELEAEVRSLGRSEQERLLRALLEELENPADLDADRAWLEEVQRRSAEFDAGLVEVIPAEQVFELAHGQTMQAGFFEDSVAEVTASIG